MPMTIDAAATSVGMLAEELAPWTTETKPRRRPVAPPRAAVKPALTKMQTETYMLRLVEQRGHAAMHIRACTRDPMHVSFV